MGQYFNAVVIKEVKGQPKTTIYDNYVSATWKNGGTCKHDMQGYKLTEHAWITNGYVEGIMAKLYNRKARVLWVGDYSDSEPFTTSDGKFTTPINLDRYYMGNCDELPLDVRQSLNITIKDEVVYNENKFMSRDKILVNETKKEYIIMNDYIKRSTMEIDNGKVWCQHPLPMLTATSNGRGGGDYRGINEMMCGAWTGDILTVKDDTEKNRTKLKDYKSLNVIFNENLEVPVEGVA